MVSRLPIQPRARVLARAIQLSVLPLTLGGDNVDASSAANEGDSYSNRRLQGKHSLHAIHTFGFFGNNVCSGSDCYGNLDNHIWSDELGRKGVAMLRKLLKSEVQFEVSVEEDDTDPRGNVLVSGDEAADKAAADEVIQRLRNGDVWAWALVKVTASWKGFKAMTVLGCCSYENEAEFRSDSYYEQMQTEALAELNSQLQMTANVLAPLEMSDDDDN